MPPSTPKAAAELIERYILPTLARAKQLASEGKILAGGPIAGKIGLALVIESDSIQELDELVERLPLWSRATTTITPLTTFDDRERAVQRRFIEVQAQIEMASQQIVSENHASS